MERSTNHVPQIILKVLYKPGSWHYSMIVDEKGGRCLLAHICRGWRINEKIWYIKPSEYQRYLELEELCGTRLVLSRQGADRMVAKGNETTTG
jgi:hypothetical protein